MEDAYLAYDLGIPWRVFANTSPATRTKIYTEHGLS